MKMSIYTSQKRHMSLGHTIFSTLFCFLSLFLLLFCSYSNPKPNNLVTRWLHETDFDPTDLCTNVAITQIQYIARGRWFIRSKCPSSWWFTSPIWQSILQLSCYNYYAHLFICSSLIFCPCFCLLQDFSGGTGIFKVASWTVININLTSIVWIQVVVLLD